MRLSCKTDFPACRDSMKMSHFDAAGEQWWMLEGSLLMSGKERKRLAVLAQVKSGELKLVTAGTVMGVMYRQARRVWQGYRVGG